MYMSANTSSAASREIFRTGRFDELHQSSLWSSYRKSSTGGRSSSSSRYARYTKYEVVITYSSSIGRPVHFRVLNGGDTYFTLTYHDGMSFREFVDAVNDQLPDLKNGSTRLYFFYDSSKNSRRRITDDDKVVDRISLKEAMQIYFERKDSPRLFVHLSDDSPPMKPPMLPQVREKYQMVVLIPPQSLVALLTSPVT